VTPKTKELLRFRCTGCGNCCKEPLLPLTAGDVRRISEHTGDKPKDFIRWVDRHGIEMDDEPEGFVMLRQGKRVMVLRHEGGGCTYLGDDNRCTICKLRRLKLIQAADCLYELDGKNNVKEMRELDARTQEASDDWHDKIAEWNKVQKKNKRSGRAAGTASQFFAFLGLG
jgi:hypothetical protein